jgi:hypothetical protein
MYGANEGIVRVPPRFPGLNLLAARADEQHRVL